MKKLILLITFITISAFQIVSAQCTPTVFSGPSFTSPDTSDVIAPAVETQLYNQIINVRIPEDTVLNGAVIAIDSAGILSVTGMPASLNWLTNSENNYWPGNSFGCVLIQGTPVIGDSGTYKVTVTIAVHALGIAMPFTLDYNVEILSQNFVGVEISKKNEFQVFQNQPNPFSNNTIINYYLPISSNIEFNVYDIVGNKVIHKEENASKGKNSISISKNNLSSGIYIYEIVNGKDAIRKRMVIK